MADGIRIQPQPGRLNGGDLAGRMIVVRDLSRPIARHPANPVCRICGHPHDCKTYHLQLDADGTVMVSTTIWERLQGLYDCGGFEKVNVVAHPPDIGIILPPCVISVTPAEF